MPRNPDMTPGRRLRLDRRKAGLSQEQLAAKLGTTLEEVSAMENNKQALSTAAKAFSASPPAGPPRPARQARPKPAALQPPSDGSTAGEEPPPPLPPEPEERREGPGPRTGGDAPPRPGPRAAIATSSQIEELEQALLHFFAGQEFVIPAEEGQEARIGLIPGVATLVGAVDEFDGQIIQLYAPAMAHAWAELARTNATVRKFLVGITYGGAWRGVAAATMPAVLAIMAHHGMLDIFRPQEHPTVTVSQNGDGGNPDQIVARCTNCGLEWLRAAIGLIPTNCSVCQGAVDFFGVAS